MLYTIYQRWADAPLIAPLQILKNLRNGARRKSKIRATFQLKKDEPFKIFAVMNARLMRAEAGRRRCTLKTSNSDANYRKSGAIR